MFSTYKKIFLLKINSGQTLLEVVLSIAIAISVVTALVILGNLSLKATNSSLRRAEASKIASAGIESVRYVKESPVCGYNALDLAIGSQSSTCYVISPNCDDLDSPGDCVCDLLKEVSCTSTDWEVISYPEIFSTFRRKIELIADERDPGTGEIVVIRAKSTVEWDEPGSATSTKSVVLETKVTDW